MVQVVDKAFIAV